MAGTETSPVHDELGKAVADRLGLNHDSTHKDWQVKGYGNNVYLTMTTQAFMTAEEFEELRVVAVRRAGKAGGRP